MFFCISPEETSDNTQAAREFKDSTLIYQVFTN
jgi:hypothetical protein